MSILSNVDFIKSTFDKIDITYITPKISKDEISSDYEYHVRHKTKILYVYNILQEILTLIFKGNDIEIFDLRFL